MGLQDSLSRVENVVPFGFVKPKRVRTLPSFSNANRVATKNGKGFLSFSPQKKLQAQRKGGCKAHKNPKNLRCHEFTSEEARHHALIRWGRLPKGTPFVPKEGK